MAWSTAPTIGATTTVASGNITLSEPTGSAQGNLLVASIAYKDTAAFTLPAGWSLVATQQSSGNTSATSDAIASGVMAYIVRGASAPSLTFTRTAGDVAHGQILRYVPDSGTPTYDTGSANTIAANSATVTTGTISTANANTLIVAMVAAHKAANVSAFDAATDPTTASGATNTTSAPTAGTWFERADSTTATGSDSGLGIADAVRATAGSTGQFSATSSNATGRPAMIVGAFYELTLNNYTLTAAAGSYTLTGQAATLKAGRVVTGAAGSFSLTGQAASLLKTSKVTADAGGYTLSGQAATLKAGRLLTGAAGSYTLSGQAATLYRALTLTGAAGSYTLSGQAATFALTRKLTAAAGAYTLSGQAATLKAGRVLTAAAGSYTLTGQAATLKAGRVATGAAGAYTLSGQAATLVTGRTLAANAGAYTLSGQAAGLTYTPNAGAYTLVAAAGVYAVVGQDATLTYVANETAGGGWLEEPDVREARQSKQRRQREIWRAMEQTIEEAYADAKGIPRKVARAEVREALAPRDPARVQAIAASLAQSGDPAAERLIEQITARLAELQAAALVYERMEQQAQILWRQQEEDAIAILLLAS